MNIFHHEKLHKAFTKATLAVSSVFLATDITSQDATVEEVIVTAQKKSENLQNVPITVQNLSSDAIESLNIRDFYDYVNQLAAVSAIQRRPGTGTLFMRGISDGGNGNNQSLQGPSVATYLDDSPVTMISDNLEVHMYDIERVEALVGPQGTLYGAASQAGSLKIITKKPGSEFDAGANTVFEQTKGGDMSKMLEGFVNIPLGKNSAVRIVGYSDDDGGYIDNVPDTLNYPLFGPVSNTAYAKENFNENLKEGYRVALRVNLNDSWTVDANVMGQTMESKGSWDYDPALGDYNTSRFTEDSNDDDFTRFSLSVSGDLGFADLNFATSSVEKDFETHSDYSHYSLSSPYVEAYYSCYTYYFYACVDPSQNYNKETTVDTSHTEIRLSSKENEKLNWIVGAFFGELETDYNTRWRIADLPSGAAVPGSENAWYQTDQIRKDEDEAFFGEVYYQITDALELTLGYRNFDYEYALSGYSGSVFYSPEPTVPAVGAFSTLSAPPENVNGQMSGSGSVSKVNLAYQLTPDTLIYTTVSEGYRPGGINRSTQIGATYKPDYLTSTEVGFKSTFNNGKTRLNAALYDMDWDDMQLGFYDVTLSKLALIDNVGKASSKGYEFDLKHIVNDKLTLSMSYASNEAELEEDYFYRGSLSAPSGTDLPLTPDVKYNFMIDYSFDDTSSMQINHVSVDEMWNDLTVSDRINQGSYKLTNINFTKMLNESLSVGMFIDNVFDELADLYINNEDGYGVNTHILHTVNRPQTVGIKFTWNYSN